tara:strand:+ start:1459 stop:1863 length:405 start_codon:yes stop_codon:yes gene_type:complete
MMDDSFHFNNVLVFKQLLFELGVRFTNRMAIPSKTTEIDSKFDEIDALHQADLIDRALALLEPNLENYSNVQCWIDKDNMLIFMLIPRVVRVEVPSLDYGMMTPDKDGVIVDLVPFSHYGGELSSSGVHKHWPS